MKKVWKIILTIFAVTGAITLLLTALGVYGFVKFAQDAKPDLPKEILLEANLEQGLIDAPPQHDPLRALGHGHGPLKLHDLTQALETAAKDDRVKALNLRLGSSGLGLAQAQEVRAAILKFKSSGKPVSAFAESFGEMGGGTIDAYIAATADDIWLQPSGDMGLVGFSAQTPLIRGTLDLLGVKPEFQRRHEYKSAVETFTEKTMSKEARSSLQSLLDSFLSQVVAGLAEGRKLDPVQVRKLIDQGPFGSKEALEAKLIDHVGYLDQADDALTDKFPDAEFVDLGDYATATAKASKGAKKIAIIHAQGPVVGGRSEQGFDGDKVIASEDIAEALSDASDDEKVAAIILRIDSPGGSYLASDTIWRAVALAREAGKPVIASVGDMAASGGYFIAMGADRIIAPEGAITGSIGVFAGKLVFNDLWSKLGLSIEEVDAGANAGFLSPNRPFTQEQSARMSRMLDRIYEDFTTKAMAGRHLEEGAIDKVARGRVFTGEQALKNGLIDELGGFETALAAAKRAAKIEAGEEVEMIYLPKPLSPVEKLLTILENGKLPLGIDALASLGDRLNAVVRVLGITQNGQQTRFAPVEFRN